MAGNAMYPHASNKRGSGGRYQHAGSVSATDAVPAATIMHFIGMSTK